MKSKPTLREGAKIELSSAASNAVMRVLEDTVNYPFKTCMLCEHFIEHDELCNLYKARPPARVIAWGCENFERDEIPF